MVSRFLTLVLALLASSLVMTATVHAREIPGPVTVECSGAVHSEGDADQSQGDSDKAIPHHHGSCHGQAMNLPATEAISLAHYDRDMRLRSAADLGIPSSPVEPGLRPPAA
ncbi:hypothetical protein EOD43_04150 [Sphingomonas crocodyli]|uniref:DUF2946 domain-containing protein n=1 Tax=Sphingomonas crocodyli TaxID=1979270 RepID=A0A437MBN7_9SPHN|nr:hypothetical protein EOD43_04150 [Sphingomonas crocodyli]